jgi:signal transduction histidine kinase
MHEFFSQNQTIVVFAHGLVFFALGFAVWLQRRRASRLVLTSALFWLAAFAVVEAFAIWGNVFIPIQQRYLQAGYIDGLHVVRALLETAGFLFMVQFGLRLMEFPRRNRVMLTAASIVAWGVILLGGALAADQQHWSAEQWSASVDNVARTTLLLVGAMLAAVGLWRQRGALSAAGMTSIRPSAAAAAAVLAVYAVIGGTIVESAPWEPGLMTKERWFAVSGIPLDLVLALAGLALCVLAANLLEIFEVEAKQREEALERSRAIAEERARFRRDLHDGTIQSIYAAALRLEAMALRAEEGVARNELRGVVADLNNVTDDIRSYITDLSQTPDTPAGIAERLREIAGEFDAESEIDVHLQVRGMSSSGPVPQGAGKHLEQIVREALANIARHAGACNADVRLAFAPDELELVISDNGCGIAAAADGHSGFGLRNMQERARRLGGRLSVDHMSPGTRIVVAIPLDVDIPDPVPYPPPFPAEVMP